MKTVFIVQGYDSRDDDGNMKEVVTYEVYAKNDKEAFEKAEKYVKKNGYRISQVIESNK